MPPFRPAFQRLAQASPLWAAALVVGWVALMSWSTHISIPLPAVPITLQSYVLLTFAALAGWQLGALAVTVYIALGLAGVPVFAGAVGGWAALSGMSAGFIAGFVVTMLGVGAMQQYWARLRPLPLFIAIVLGHLVLMALGAGWIAVLRGTAFAFEQAFMPLVPGAMVKSIAALATVIVVERLSGTPRS